MKKIKDLPIERTLYVPYVDIGVKRAIVSDHGPLSYGCWDFRAEDFFQKSPLTHGLPAEFLLQKDLV
jgi:hypothetical protein